jgi:hypothetical protein
VFYSKNVFFSYHFVFIYLLLVFSSLFIKIKNQNKLEKKLQIDGKKVIKEFKTMEIYIGFI